MADQKTQWHNYNFASKFAHFFINSERFPIYDSYAVRMIAYHLGRKGYVIDTLHPYVAYVINQDRIRERSGLHWGGSELDRYLWLSGQYLAWMKNSKAPINTEIAKLFIRPPENARTDLVVLSLL